LLIISLITLGAAGCANILEGDIHLSTRHVVQQLERPPEEQIEVANFDVLKAEILELIMEHERSGLMYAINYDGDISADILRACNELKSDNPVVAYAVSEISGDATRIVSYYEVTVNIEYKFPKQQVDAIVNVSNQRYLRTELLSAMSEYEEELVFRTTLNITEYELDNLVRDIYYNNPGQIVMKPATTVEIFPRRGEDRIFRLRFGYIEDAGILAQHGTNLALYTRRNAELAVGEDDAEILLSLAENLVATCVFDEYTAKAISVHGAQNFAATAAGVASGSAVGEGFAMAFKALCDTLGFEGCRIILGHLDGMIHAWNIVLLRGNYYHIDVAMCAVEGFEGAFLKNDTDMAGRYEWDRDNTVICVGTLTYKDIVGADEEEGEEGEEGEPGEPGEPGTESGDETGETPETPDVDPSHPPEPPGETPEQPAEEP